MQSFSHPRVTPWVLRLGLANLAVLLLLETLFISPGLHRALAFDPVHALQRPWTFVTYMFVHANLLHLLVNMLILWFFGSQLEARMSEDGRHPWRFVAFYLFCGIGAAIFGATWGAFIAWFGMSTNQYYMARDYTWPWRAARALLQGHDPYQVVAATGDWISTRLSRDNISRAGRALVARSARSGHDS